MRLDFETVPAGSGYNHFPARQRKQDGSSPSKDLALLGGYYHRLTNRGYLGHIQAGSYLYLYAK